MTYTDGVNNETIFEDEVHQSVKYGASVPAYKNGTNPSRENYTFAGWEPSVPATMPANSLKFMAKWEKDPVDDGTFDFNDVVSGDDKDTPAITKTVKGNVGKNFKETFKVTVEPKSDNAENTMTPNYYTGKAEVTYSDLKDIAFQFAENDKLTFRDGGKYTYTVRELPGQTSRMSYDTTEYTLKINVVLDEDSNTYTEIRKLRTYYDDFKGWAEEFDTAPLEMKRMILSHLIDRVEVGRKYQVIVKFNMKYRQFLECTAETYNTEIGA